MRPSVIHCYEEWADDSLSSPVGHRGNRRRDRPGAPRPESTSGRAEKEPAPQARRAVAGGRRPQDPAPRGRKPTVVQECRPARIHAYCTVQHHQQGSQPGKCQAVPRRVDRGRREWRGQDAFRQAERSRPLPAHGAQLQRGSPSDRVREGGARGHGVRRAVDAEAGHRMRYVEGIRAVHAARVPHLPHLSHADAAVVPCTACPRHLRGRGIDEEEQSSLRLLHRA